MGSILKSEFGVIRKPRITEKSALSSARKSTYVFEVHPDANKAEISRAVEKIFSVKVAAVRTLNMMGKVRKVRTSIGRKAAWKKAYVSLQAGHSIEVIEGL